MHIHQFYRPVGADHIGFDIFHSAKAAVVDRLRRRIVEGSPLLSSIYDHPANPRSCRRYHVRLGIYAARRRGLHHY